MADTTLHFKLGSSFDGSGFTAANKEIQTAAQEGKKLSGALGNVIGEAQKLDGALGKTAGAVGNVVNGFAQLGLVGGIVAGAKSAMDLFFDSAKAGLDKTVAANKEAADAAHRALQKTVDEHIKGVHAANEQTRALGKEAIAMFDETAAAAVKASQLIAQTDIARGQHSIASVQVEKLNAIIKEETDAGKALVAAKYDVQIAEMKSAQAAERAASSVDEARAGVETARQRNEMASENLARCEQTLARVREEAARMAKVRSADTSKMAAEVKVAEAAYRDALKEQRKSANGVSEAEERLKAETLRQSTAREEGQVAILQAKIALDKLNEAERKAAEAREKEADAARKAAEATQQYADMEAAIVTHAQDKESALVGEIQQLQKEIKEISDNIEHVREGMDKDAEVKNGIMGKYVYALDNLGNPDNFIDWQRAERFAKRAERDAKNRARRDSQYQKKMQDLQDKLNKRGEKALTDREKAQLKAWNAYKESKDGRERREKEIKAREKEIDRIRKQMAEDIKETRKMLEESLKLN